MSRGEGDWYKFYKMLTDLMKQYKDTLMWFIAWSDTFLVKQKSYSRRFLSKDIWKKIWGYTNADEIQRLIREAKKHCLKTFPLELREKFEEFCWGYLEVKYNDGVSSPHGSKLLSRAVRTAIVQMARLKKISEHVSHHEVQEKISWMTDQQIRVMEQYCKLNLIPLSVVNLNPGKTHMINVKKKLYGVFEKFNNTARYFAEIRCDGGRKIYYIDEYGFDIHDGIHFQVVRIKPPQKTKRMEEEEETDIVKKKIKL